MDTKRKRLQCLVTDNFVNRVRSHSDQTETGASISMMLRHYQSLWNFAAAERAKGFIIGSLDPKTRLLVAEYENPVLNQCCITTNSG
ncbi:MAG: hypothetical protein A3H57_01830 [Candidatus Taylorbacteria bacterium RIFCSPLOWO2_02_FULL_43_11]|nr:MAG: hypothetical protein A2743_00450 [Candidatus Taylorbacteria bacterium RIFCSPHIGHO2_01_FULL_43_47]OHA30928.1 MAG: hypothetical protein A3B08_03965 [Candidatus Taylorbacteria bacterium RIFCSPLOWO2_01_FULL_43_44]OHA37616.1 MAG: hypothetical protein A3H57_01830 [Candidatus Taylorbacteria bacterium RIFCSPLOWO2_02_FULL_43_11]